MVAESVGGSAKDRPRTVRRISAITVLKSSLSGLVPPPLPEATMTAATSCSLTLVCWEISRSPVDASSARQARNSMIMTLACSMTGRLARASRNCSTRDRELPRVRRDDAPTSTAKPFAGRISSACAGRTPSPRRGACPVERLPDRVRHCDKCQSVEPAGDQLEGM
jgi:hypothetical protein